MMILQNVASAVMGGLLTVIIMNSYNWYSNRNIETEQEQRLNAYISSTYEDLCLYLGVQDHFENFDPNTFVRNHIKAMKAILEPDITNIKPGQLQSLLVILSNSEDLIDNDIFLRADQQPDGIGDGLFSEINHFDEIYFDQLRNLNWLKLPASKCADVKDFFLNSR